MEAERPIAAGKLIATCVAFHLNNFVTTHPCLFCAALVRVCWLPRRPLLAICL